MSHRPLAIFAALTLALTLPVASARASDPLLSGYGGPGGGEQVVLGGSTVKSPKSSSGASAPAQDPATAPLDASAGASSSGTSSGSASGGSALTRKPQRKKSSSSASQPKSDADEDTTQATTTTKPVALRGAPKVVAYPTRAGEVGGLPITAPGVLLLVLGVAAAALVGLGLRRLSGFDRGHDPQVSGR